MLPLNSVMCFVLGGWCSGGGTEFFFWEGAPFKQVEQWSKIPPASGSVEGGGGMAWAKNAIDRMFSCRSSGPRTGNSSGNSSGKQSEQEIFCPCKEIAAVKLCFNTAKM